jgi:hypothetical protein
MKKSCYAIIATILTGIGDILINLNDSRYSIKKHILVLGSQKACCSLEPDWKKIQ